VASLSEDVPVFSLNGVSKVYYAPGWRIGYLAIHDPSGVLLNVRDGIERLLRSRLCASTPAQLGYLAGLNGNRDWMNEHMSKVQSRRQLCLDRISKIDGLEVEAPGGAFYMFVRLTDEMWSKNDKEFVLQLLHQEHVLVVHGSGFSPEKGAGHIRIVYLADEKTLNTAFDRIDSFLQRNRTAKK
jgi:aspartate/methionine/tyrosine aminotransferase